jgi:hypothetical protein
LRAAAIISGVEQALQWHTDSACSLVYGNKLKEEKQDGIEKNIDKSNWKSIKL